MEGGERNAGKGRGGTDVPRDMLQLHLSLTVDQSRVLCVLLDAARRTERGENTLHHAPKEKEQDALPGADAENICTPCLLPRESRGVPELLSQEPAKLLTKSKTAANTGRKLL